MTKVYCEELREISQTKIRLHCLVIFPPGTLLARKKTLIWHFFIFTFLIYINVNSTMAEVYFEELSRIYS